MVNQVEFNCFLYQSELLDYCKNNNIVVTAYAPLANAKKFETLKLKELSGKYKKSQAQIMLRWGLQKGLVIVPKSKNCDRIKENANLYGDFVISQEDMTALDELHENYRVYGDHPFVDNPPLDPLNE